MFCQQSTWKDLCFCPTRCLQCIVIIVEKSVSNGQTVFLPIARSNVCQVASCCLSHLYRDASCLQQCGGKNWSTYMFLLILSLLNSFWLGALFLSWPELFAFAAGAVGGVAVPFTVATWCAAYRGILPGKTVASIQHLHAHPLHKYTCTYIYIYYKIIIIIKIKKTSQ